MNRGCTLLPWSSGLYNGLPLGRVSFSSPQPSSSREELWCMATEETTIRRSGPNKNGWHFPTQIQRWDTSRCLREGLKVEREMACCDSSRCRCFCFHTTERPHPTFSFPLICSLFSWISWNFQLSWAPEKSDTSPTALCATSGHLKGVFSGGSVLPPLRSELCCCASVRPALAAVKKLSFLLQLQSIFWLCPLKMADAWVLQRSKVTAMSPSITTRWRTGRTGRALSLGSNKNTNKADGEPTDYTTNLNLRSFGYCQIIALKRKWLKRAFNPVSFGACCVKGVRESVLRWAEPFSVGEDEDR